MNRLQPRRLSQKARKEQRTAYMCLIPAFIGLIVLTYVPLLAVFVISFFQWKGISSPHFNGIANYVRLFTSAPYFKDSIAATVYFSVLAVAGSMIYSLVVAILLNRKIPARGFWRAVFYLPYVLPAAAVYIGWSWLYETNFGLFNFILKSIGIQNVMFLTDSDYVVPSLALIAVWLSGNLIVIFLAGLQNVPRVYHEAAEIDGANAWQRFRHVTLPSMSPIIFYNLLMALITNMRVVEQQRRPAGGVEVATVLEHPNGCRFTHYLSWDGNAPVVTVWTEVENRGTESATLEQLASFSLGGLSPLLNGAAPGQLRLHRLRSSWSMEGRLCTDLLERLNLEPSWARHGVRWERFGQVGSLPVNGWFPWMVLEDAENGVFWGCLLAHNASWQMEVCRQDVAVALTGGLADYGFGHWRKTLRPGARFQSPPAYLTVCRGKDVDDAARRLVHAMDADIPAAPLPLFFNEYCTTWGVPSAQSVTAQLACQPG